MQHLEKFCFLGLIIIFSVLIVHATKTEVNVDVVNNIPYIDYTISFDSNFSIFLPDFTKKIYAKSLPEDINYRIIKSYLYVDTNKPGIIVLKYQATPFLEDVKSYKKTLNFDLLGKSKIELIVDENIIQTTDGYTKDENTLVWNTDQNHFILYVVLPKNPFDYRVILIIIASIVVILMLLYPLFKKRFFKQNKIKNIYLNNTQKEILNILKHKEGINQQKLSDLLKIKKSNMSKILNKMERNELIERKKVGKINKLFLTKKK